MLLTFDVNAQTLTRTDKNNPATDSVDYLTAKFTFNGAEWNGIEKVALFKAGDVLKEARLNASGECVVPWEVLVKNASTQGRIYGDSNRFYVSVVGVNGTVQIPTVTVRVDLGASGYGEGTESEDPTPDLYAQYVADVKGYADSVEATAEEIRVIESGIKDSYANAFKGEASGEIVRVDDVSPVEHSAKVVVTGVDDPSTVTVTRYGKNIIPSEKIVNEQWKHVPHYESRGVSWTVSDDRRISIQGETSEGDYSVFDIATSDRFNSWLSNGATYTVSLNTVGNGEVELVSEIYDNDKNVVGYIRDGVTFTVDKDKYTYGTLRLQILPSTIINVTVAPQIEIGAVSTDFEPYNCTSYTPNTDGSVDITSVSPTMTLLTDTDGVTIDLEYNRDTTSVIGDIESAVIKLNEIADSLIGGVSE